MADLKARRCGIKAIFEERKVEYIYRRKGKYLIVSDVPCEVCLSCGECYYPAEALLAIENRFKAIHEEKNEPCEELLLQGEPQATLTVPVESFALVAA